MSEITKEDMVVENRWKKSTNFHHIGIVINSVCNLSCDSCTAGVPMYKGKHGDKTDNMTISQIEKFIKESIDNNKIWSKITILGGEPTLHPDVYEICRLLCGNIKKISSNNLEILSNRSTELIRNTADKLLYDFGVKQYRLAKPKYGIPEDTNVFRLFYNAPKDSNFILNSENFNCFALNDCQMALNKYGYFPVNACATIDALFKLGVGIKHLKDLTQENVWNQQKHLCKFCGFASSNRHNPKSPDSAYNIGKPINYMSESWKQLMFDNNDKEIETY